MSPMSPVLPDRNEGKGKKVEGEEEWWWRWEEKIEEEEGGGRLVLFVCLWWVGWCVVRKRQESGQHARVSSRGAGTRDRSSREHARTSLTQAGAAAG